MKLKDGVTQDEADCWSELVRKEIERIVAMWNMSDRSVYKMTGNPALIGVHTHKHTQMEDKHGMTGSNPPSMPPTKIRYQDIVEYNNTRSLADHPAYGSWEGKVDGVEYQKEIREEWDT